LVFVEPSAGNGDFFYSFPVDETKYAFDIDMPSDIDDPLYKETDFLKVSSSSRYSNGYIKDAEYSIPSDAIYVGNPPFGKSGSLAFEFIMKCIDLDASIIAFILPPNINTNSRLESIRMRGYEIVYIRNLNDDSFYFYNGQKETEMSAESNFQIYMRSDLVEKTGTNIVKNINLKNNEYVQVYTINDNNLFNTKRDTEDNKFIQEGVGTK
jgi:hypothetical protein